jgi:predicted Zn-dependent protease
LSLQEPAKAIPHLERAVAIKPDDVLAKSALGRALLQSGRAAEAIPYLDTALPSDKDGNLHYLLTQAHLRSGNREAASRLLARREELRRAASTEASDQESKFQVTAPQ